VTCDLAEDFGAFDRLLEIVEAHTIGAEAASPAAQIFFLADSMASDANRREPETDPVLRAANLKVVILAEFAALVVRGRHG
jgi:HD superfamily phosphohydrolase YqeK